eukprot:c16486_g1_i1.p1 GENE.c16486_g1_i1~~c16486_g1_i1.p1  ORF type:complete len:296 (+),score=99.86 c16486_g1_i1:32-919(+)
MSSQPKTRPKKKVVIRKLPPALQEEDFKKEIASYLHLCDWCVFCPGEPAKKIHARAYLHFNSADDVPAFSKFFNGHVFLDARGIEYRVSVEYAPFQKIPRPKGEKDHRDGTIEKDPDYIEFVEKLTNPQKPNTSADVLFDQFKAQREGPDKISPLIEDILNRKAKKAAMRSTNLGNYSHSRRGPKKDNRSGNSRSRGSENKRNRSEKEGRNENKRRDDENKFSKPKNETITKTEYNRSNNSEQSEKSPRQETSAPQKYLSTPEKSENNRTRVSPQSFPTPAPGTFVIQTRPKVEK